MAWSSASGERLELYLCHRGNPGVLLGACRGSFSAGFPAQNAEYESNGRMNGEHNSAEKEWSAVFDS